MHFSVAPVSAYACEPLSAYADQRCPGDPHFYTTIDVILAKFYSLAEPLALSRVVLRMPSYWNFPPRRATFFSTVNTTTKSMFLPRVFHRALCQPTSSFVILKKSGWLTPKLVLRFVIGTLMTFLQCFTTNANEFLRYVSSCYGNIKFTIEFEQTGQCNSFLGHSCDS